MIRSLWNGFLSLFDSRYDIHPSREWLRYG